MVYVTLRSSFLTVASEPNLTNSGEVQEAIRGLKFSKAPSPNSIPNRALKHIHQRAVSPLTQIFNAIILTHLFPAVWKHPRVIFNPKSEKDPALP
jgi:hypothetical protein